MAKRTGLATVFVMHCEGFHDHLRPSHDSAPTCYVDMTDAEVDTLKSIISRYVGKCRERRKREAGKAKRWQRQCL